MFLQKDIPKTNIWALDLSFYQLKFRRQNLMTHIYNFRLFYLLSDRVVKTVILTVSNVYNLLNISNAQKIIEKLFRCFSAFRLSRI